ncbi:MAG: hypothetical protein OIF50_11355 [Flavobacteriaceae bacterium]|nr:hypothetical protein [Flavobacteriaceae bacterium]
MRKDGIVISSTNYNNGNTLSTVSRLSGKFWFGDDYRDKKARKTMVSYITEFGSAGTLGLYSSFRHADKVYKAYDAYRAARSSTTALKVNPIKLTTSSGSLAPSRTYTIYNRFGELHKFGVTDANLVRYGQSLKSAGPGAYGKFSSIMYKGKTHTMEKYLRSLHFNSTGQYSLPGMKIPYPVNFNTGLPIKL